MSSGFSVFSRGPQLVSSLVSSSSSEAPLKVVCFGGGTGLSTLLRGLKHHVSRRAEAGAAEIGSITAVVSVMDDGGSSGRLRSDFEVLPPGDIRNCLVALAEDEALLARLFDYRFAAGSGLAGHSLGNLLITALTDITQDFAQAVKLSSLMLATRGRVLPATTTQAQLYADLADGKRLVGESAIGTVGTPIRRVGLLPANCEPLPETLQAIAEADLITLGPGSLFTSLLPHLLVRGIPQAIAASRAAKVFVCNIMTQANETLGFTAADHLTALLAHGSVPLFDTMLVNRGNLASGVTARYAEEGATPVDYDAAELAAMGVNVVEGNFAAESSMARHDPHRLAADLLRIAIEHRTRRQALPAAA